jgi:hypothetical protein
METDTEEKVNQPTIINQKNFIPQSVQQPCFVTLMLMVYIIFQSSNFNFILFIYTTSTGSKEMTSKICSFLLVRSCHFFVKNSNSGFFTDENYWVLSFLSYSNPDVLCSPEFTDYSTGSIKVEPSGIGS